MFEGRLASRCMPVKVSDRAFRSFQSDVSPSFVLCPFLSYSPSSIIHVRCKYIHIYCLCSSGQCPVSLSAVNSLHVQCDFSLTLTDASFLILFLNSLFLFSLVCLFLISTPSAFQYQPFKNINNIILFFFTALKHTNCIVWYNKHWHFNKKIYIYTYCNLYLKVILIKMHVLHELLYMQ